MTLQLLGQALEKAFQCWLAASGISNGVRRELEADFGAAHEAGQVGGQIVECAIFRHNTCTMVKKDVPVRETCSSVMSTAHRLTSSQLFMRSMPGNFPQDPPARVFVNVSGWPGRFKIEIDCVAAVS